MFENDTDIDAFERAVAALVRAAPISSLDRQRLSPVVKRAAKVRKPVAQELARLLLFVATGQRTIGRPAVDHGGNPSSVQAQLIARIDDLMDVSAQGRGLPVLGTNCYELYETGGAESGEERPEGADLWNGRMWVADKPATCNEAPTS